MYPKESPKTKVAFRESERLILGGKYNYRNNRTNSTKNSITLSSYK
jgi:hypothetical protein